MKRVSLLLFLLWSAPAAAQAAQCAPDNGGITLPPGFCASVFADFVGIARHVVAAPNGDLFVSLGEARRSTTSMIGRLHPDSGDGGIVWLRDTNGDGRADQSSRVRADAATGLALQGSWIYLATRLEVMRFRIDLGRFGVWSAPDTVITGFPEGGHNSKSLAFDDVGRLFVSVGSNSNVCRQSRTDTAPDPCPEMPIRSGIWRYSTDRLRQRHPEDGERWATGIRNAVGLTWSREYNGLYATSHGRDGLHGLFPQLFTAEKNAETPSEEFMRVDRGDDFGWPYCYHDRQLGLKVLAPEYGGDGRRVDRCSAMKAPLVGFPGHWGPNALRFYTGTSFPAKYRGGAFVAFHGSWNRLPLSEQGYNVVFAPFRDGRPTGAFEVFAEGFHGDTLEPILARHRPTGLAVSPDGALFISDDQRGRIWRVVFRGSRD